MFGDGETWQIWIHLDHLEQLQCISVLRTCGQLWPVRPEDGLDRMGLMLGGSDEDNKVALVLFMVAWYCLVAGFGSAFLAANNCKQAQ